MVNAIPGEREDSTRSSNMKEVLPEIPLDPRQFAKEMQMSPQRLIRVIRAMEPPLQIVDGLIPTVEYPRLYECIVGEPVFIHPVENTELPQNHDT